MAEIGELITLGAYPQSSTSFSCKEPIQWVILAREEGRSLCISRRLLDCKPYHRTDELVSWAGCTLREWLNRDFLAAAFSQEEQARILLAHLTNHKSCPQLDTRDKIFLLDHDEAVDHFESQDHPMTRTALTTCYARAQGAWFLSPEEAGDDEAELAYAGSWWLRCPAVAPRKTPTGFLMC